jgi:hypothetical protein
MDAGQTGVDCLLLIMRLLGYKVREFIENVLNECHLSTVPRRFLCEKLMGRIRLSRCYVGRVCVGICIRNRLNMSL